MHRNWWWWQSIEISTYFPIRIYYTHFFDKINIIDTRMKTNAIFVSWIFDCLFCIEMVEFPVLAARLWVYIEIWFEMQRIKYLSEKKFIWWIRQYRYLRFAQPDRMCSFAQLYGIERRALRHWVFNAISMHHLIFIFTFKWTNWISIAWFRHVCYRMKNASDFYFYSFFSYDFPTGYRLSSIQNIKKNNNKKSFYTFRHEFECLDFFCIVWMKAQKNIQN